MIIHRKQGQKREKRRTKKPSTLLGLGITWSISTFVNAPSRISTDSCYGIQMAHLNTLPFPLIGLICTCDSVLASERQEKSIGIVWKRFPSLTKRQSPLGGKLFHSYLHLIRMRETFCWHTQDGTAASTNVNCLLLDLLWKVHTLCSLRHE